MDSILFGSDSEEHIVAVNQSGDSSVTLFSRNNDIVTLREEKVFPFFHLSDKRFIESFPLQHWVKKLEGANHFQYLCAFPSLSILWEAIHFAVRKINKELKTGFNSYLETNQILFRPDISTQYLLQSGKTLFKGMEFRDVYRMQLDIETYSAGNKFSRAERKDDRIILISLSDTQGWETVLGGKHVSEKNLLQQCIKLISEKNPDVIEGHNIYNFDLPYILKRCELHEIEFAIGRDGSIPKGFSSRSSFAEKEIEYTSYELFGRHIIDTWLLVEAYDMTKRSMESHGLKYAAKYFDVSAVNRQYIEADKISWHWDHDPESLKKNALDDVIETRAISNKLSGTIFYLTQMLPFNYGTLAKLGSAAKIESLFLREYIRQRYSIPRPQKGSQTSGGYTNIFYTGIFTPIIHADVESLYPSIMLSMKIKPITDDLDVFLYSLQYLTKLRIETKRSLKDITDPQEHSRLDAMQSSFKILINSFYGYLGYGRALFNDYSQADVITTSGQELLHVLIKEINIHNGIVIEVDTDGIYFIPPDNVVGEQAERTFVEHLSTSLPEGINLGFSGRFNKIFSYKKKNYALLHYDNRITIRGSALISRNIERFGRSYLEQMIECLLNNKVADLHKLYVELEKSIAQHGIDVLDFSKVEMLKDSLQDYKKEVEEGKRNRSAVYEVALKSTRNVKQGDRIRYYISGTDAHVKGFEAAKEAQEWDANFPNENTAYYLKRLEEFSKKFEIFFSEKDYEEIFSTDNLFEFDATKIIVLNKKVEEINATEQLKDNYSIEFDV